jgi:hypothetical protein
MIKRGILIFNHQEQEWRVWIGQHSYWIDQGYSFELRIQNRYFHAFLEKDLEWLVTLNDDVIFILHTNEVYKVRVNIHDYIKVEAPL